MISGSAAGALSLGGVAGFVARFYLFDNSEIHHVISHILGSLPQLFLSLS